MIPAGIVLFPLLLATFSWSFKAAIDGHAAPWLRPGVFIAAVALMMALTAYTFLGDDLSALRWQIPLLVAVIFLLLAALAAFRRRAATDRRSAHRSGRHAQGTVTDDGLAEFGSTPNVKLAHLTVSFVDDTGQERWVTPLAKQLPSKPLAVGDKVDVWYQPGAPGDVKQIVVEGDNGASRIIPGQLR